MTSAPDYSHGIDSERALKYAEYVGIVRSRSAT